MSKTVEASVVTSLREAVAALRSGRSNLRSSELDFFAEYVQTQGAALPVVTEDVPGLEAVDATTLCGLKTAVASLRGNPSALRAPELAFFREYLESLRAKPLSEEDDHAAADIEGDAPAVVVPSGVQVVSSKAEFDALAGEARAAKVPLVIDFTASWCPPCRAIAPVFSELAETYAGQVLFVKADVDVAQDLASTFGISAMPTFKFFGSAGQQVDKLRGASVGSLKAKVARLASGQYPADAVEDIEESTGLWAWLSGWFSPKKPT